MALPVWAMSEEPCVGQNSNVGGVPLREYIELLVDSRTTEIKLVMAERIEAVHTAYERHQEDHKAIEKDMEHLNELRQDVVKDRALLVPLPTFNTYRESISDWMTLFGNQLSTLRGQLVGGGAVIAIAFAAIQIVIAYYK